MYGGGHFWHMRFGFPPFGFYFHGPRPFPSRQEYLDMLEDYKKELEKELKGMKGGS